MAEDAELETWWSLASSPSVVRRASLYAIVVGAILIAINHGDAILAGEVRVNRVWRMLLTIAVPYIVSTLSSVGALRRSRKPAAAVRAQSPRGSQSVELREQEFPEEA